MVKKDILDCYNVSYFALSMMCVCVFNICQSYNYTSGKRGEILFSILFFYFYFFISFFRSYHATAGERGRGHTRKKKISTMRNVGIILISHVLHFDLASHKYLATTISRYRSQYLIFSYFTLILYFIIFHL